MYISDFCRCSLDLRYLRHLRFKQCEYGTMISTSAVAELQELSIRNGVMTIGGLVIDACGYSRWDFFRGQASNEMVYLSINQSIYRSIFLSIHLSIYLYIYIYVLCLSYVLDITGG